MLNFMPIVYIGCIVHLWADHYSSHSFCLNDLILCLHDADPLDICMKKFHCIKIIFDKMTALRTWKFFLAFLQVKAFRGRSTPTTVFDGAVLCYAYMMQTHWTFA